MKKINLSGGPATVYVHHTTTERRLFDGLYWSPMALRCTKIELHVDNQSVPYSSIAECSPRDNFSRAFGRKLAATRLIKLLPKQDRAAVMKAICPEFFKR